MDKDKYLANKKRTQEVLEQLSKDKVGRTVGEGIGAAVGFVVGGLLIATGVFAPVGWGIVAFMLSAATVGASIGAAIDPVKPPEFGGSDYQSGSPTYSFGPLQHTVTNQLPVAIIYGRMKVAGNVIWQSDPAETIDRIQCICNGEIESISDVKVNDITLTDIDGCSYDAYMGTAAQTVDSRATDKVNGLKRTAYLAYTLKSGEKLKGGNPVVTCLVEGLKVKTWNGSIWTGSTYSQNPAACVRDFLTNEVYGVGIPEGWIDAESFGEVSEYCDVLVDDGDGGTEARFTLNFAIDTTRPALDILNDMFATFSGFLCISGEKIKLRVEKSGDIAVQALTMDNVIDGSFGYSQTPKDEAVNKVMVQYVDPDYEWQKIYALAENKVSQDTREALLLGRSVIEKKIAIFGITRFSQASRMANRYLRSATYCSTYCTVSVGVASLFCEVGDIVTVSHDVPSWTAKPFRILSIEETEKDTLRLLMREYVEEIYDDEFGSISPHDDYGSVANPFAPVTDVTDLAVLETGYTDVDGTYIPQISVSWTAPTDNTREFLDGYVVQLKKDDEAYTEITRLTQSATSYIVTPVEGGHNYYVKVKTVSAEGILSTGATSSQISIAGNEVGPGNVTGFASTFTNEITFTWNRNTEADVIQYEIRKADSNWGTINSDFVWIGDAVRYTVVRPEARSGITYYIKARNRSGLYSTDADSDTPENLAPAAPTLEGTDFFGVCRLGWNDVGDKDLLYYEIWKSANNAWAGEETLESRVAGGSYSGGLKYIVKSPTASGTTNYFKVIGVDTFASGTYSNVYTNDFVGIGENDIPGNTITVTMIDDGAIETPKLAANAVTADKVTTGELLTLSAQIKDAIINNAKIIDLDGSKITANSITLTKLAADATPPKTYYQAAEPDSGMVEGDYWVDTDDDSLHTYNGAAWISVSAAGSGITTFRQSAVPTAVTAGDLWIDTDDQKLYRATNAGDDEIKAGEWELQNAAIATGWSHGSDTTKIDGGDIYTGTITAGSIAASGITADKLSVSQLDAVAVNTGTLTVDETINVGTSKVVIDGVNVVIKVYDDAATPVLRVELGKLS